jgi:hypothetical protein
LINQASNQLIKQSGPGSIQAPFLGLPEKPVSKSLKIFKRHKEAWKNHDFMILLPRILSPALLNLAQLGRSWGLPEPPQDKLKKLPIWSLPAGTK